MLGAPKHDPRWERAFQRGHSSGTPLLQSWHFLPHEFDSPLLVDVHAEKPHSWFEFGLGLGLGGNPWPRGADDFLQGACDRVQGLGAPGVVHRANAAYHPALAQGDLEVRDAPETRGLDRPRPAV